MLPTQLPGGVGGKKESLILLGSESPGGIDEEECSVIALKSNIITLYTVEARTAITRRDLRLRAAKPIPIPKETPITYYNTYKQFTKDVLIVCITIYFVERNLIHKQ
ncbi:hypothetical protein [Wolbachia endosymbiont of Mansonella ozzardi]|uniref:hypothetical protein n=1 Tax=Wolbachia endosymbiont of Mansonella ozzardi TaxID=137464 RepID=UPI001CE1F24D|nr:hypothetical protein [Wolbachia endosymbiont of Mansonella ozzardi]